MINSRMTRERAESNFHPKSERSEKGSAVRTIQASRLLVQAKSAKLKELRLARDATIIVAPAKPAKPAKSRRTKQGA
ncbi:hypothetical protein [Jiella pacifica]|uniref:Uncharacterized protein n=1 Tax=Jiella pacifica TaxID=2696469 RepID=A0A6N9T2C1_9HYPH|nr:hypothetical protein [Jiella pacifica]NDW04019.1 hypothetical protein [Jiella pacifica]